MQKILGTLKIRSAPIDERIYHRVNSETFDCNTKAGEGKEIFKGMKKLQNNKCFNASRIVHLRRVDKSFLEKCCF